MRIRRHIRCLLRGISAAMAVAVIAAACGGDADTAPTSATDEAAVVAPTPTPSEASASELESTADAATTDTQAAASATTAVDEIGQHAPLVSAVYDPATTPPLGDFDVERLAAAAKTLDPEMDCPAAMVPESLENVAEVLRIERGCDVIEYVQLGGRSVQELRAELFASDETVYAVGLPPADLVPLRISDDGLWEPAESLQRGRVWQGGMVASRGSRRGHALGTRRMEIHNRRFREPKGCRDGETAKSSWPSLNPASPSTETYATT